MTCVVHVGLVFCLVSDQLELFIICPFYIVETVNWSTFCSGRCIYVCHVDMRAGWRAHMDADDRSYVMRHSSFHLSSSTNDEKFIHIHGIYPASTVFITCGCNMGHSLSRSELAKTAHVSCTRLSPKLPIGRQSMTETRSNTGLTTLGIARRGMPKREYASEDRLTLTTSPSFLT